MSFVGAKVSQYLYDKGEEVIAIEDAINIEPDPMRWYRWTELHKLGLSATIVEFSDSNFDKLKNVVQQNDIVIVYVPTGIIEWNKIDHIKRYQVGLSHVAHINKLLLTLKPEKITNIILLSFASNNLVQKTWMTTIEQSLLSYHHKTSVRTTIIKVKDVFGPWQDEIKDISPSWWYIDDIARVVDILQTTVEGNNGLIIDINSNIATEFKLTTFDNGLKSTLKWREEMQLKKHETKNVVAGGFATKNSTNYFANWMTSALAFNLSVVLIHNIVKQSVLETIMKASPNVELAKYQPPIKRPAHEQRFYVLYDYLLNHPEINYFIVNDIRDTETVQDPMKIMSAIGDYFFAASDIPFYNEISIFPWLKRSFEHCFPNFKNKEELFSTHGVFNSGVIGGTRHVMLTILSRILLLLEVAHVGHLCDMVSQQIVFHMYYNRVVCTYPISGGYLLGMPGPYGMAMKHKKFQHHNGV